jgi:hypothetical protein
MDLHPQRVGHRGHVEAFACRFVALELCDQRLHRARNLEGRHARAGSRFRLAASVGATGEHVDEQVTHGLHVGSLSQVSTLARAQGDGSAPRIRRRARPVCTRGEPRRLEADDLDRIVRAHQHVLGAERPVDEHEAVRGLEPLGDLQRQAERALDTQRPFLAKDVD